MRIVRSVTAPHQVLGVDPDADPETIEAAYRRRVKETHPDQGGSVEAFRRVTAAYDTLTNGGRSHASDAEGAREAGWSGGRWQRRAGARESEETGAETTRTGAETTRTGAETTRTGAETTVEYLNYEVLDDHGWSLADDDLFEKAAGADLPDADYGTLRNPREDAVLEAAEACDYTWPYSCRGGACANCAVKVLEGDMSTPVDHILTEDLIDRGFRLSCLGVPTSGRLRLVYNVKHMPDLEELLLPPGPFARAND